jgi:hypothetical protein
MLEILPIKQMFVMTLCFTPIVAIIQLVSNL